MVLVPHMRTTGFAKVQALLKTPIKTTEAVYSVKSKSYIRPLICTLLFLMREFASEQNSVFQR